MIFGQGAIFADSVQRRSADPFVNGKRASFRDPNPNRTPFIYENKHP